MTAVNPFLLPFYRRRATDTTVFDVADSSYTESYAHTVNRYLQRSNLRDKRKRAASYRAQHTDASVIIYTENRYLLRRVDFPVNSGYR